MRETEHGDPYACRKPLGTVGFLWLAFPAGAQQGRPARPQRVKGRGGTNRTSCGPFAHRIDPGERKSPYSYSDLWVPVEDLNDARTQLADFFSILLFRRELCGIQFQQTVVAVGHMFDFEEAIADVDGARHHAAVDHKNKVPVRRIFEETAYDG